MIKEPPVSIYIITCLESEERCELLRSVCQNALDQNYSDFEVVVADNAGPIDAATALSSIADERLKIYRNEENVGFTGNINRCLDYCKNDVIKLNCDDDLLHPDFLKNTVPYVNDDTLVVVDYKKFDVRTNPLEVPERLPETAVAIREKGYRNDFWTFSFISLPGCTLFTKKLFSDIGGYDSESPLSDLDFLMEARLRNRMVHVKLDLCYMGIWDGSLTQEMLQSNPYFFDTGELYTMFRFLKFKKLELIHRSCLAGRMIKHFIWQSMRLLRHPFQKRYWKGYGEYVKSYALGLFMRTATHYYHEPRYISKVSD